MVKRNSVGLAKRLDPSYIPGMEMLQSDAAGPLHFRKMHGLGNDFVVIDRRETGGRVLTAGLVRAIGDRHRGVGFDQLAEFSMDDGRCRISFWNADGSTAGACGNATRCIAELIMDECATDRVAMETANGTLAGSRRADGLIEIDMGPVHLDWDMIPLAEEVDTVSMPLDGAPGAVNVGNPHAVFFVKDAEAVDLAHDGPEWEHHPMFPQRANIEFCHVISPSAIRMRVWERGGMITQACGSGACAAVVAGFRKGLIERQAAVHLDGGVLEIRYRQDGRVTMAGPTAHVFEGTLPASFVAEHL